MTDVKTSDKFSVKVVSRQIAWVNGTAFEVIIRSNGDVTYSRASKSALAKAGIQA